MTKKIIAEPLAEVIAEYAEDVHLTYSGRGMYGETCYGFSGDVARIIGDVLQDLADMPDLIRQWRDALRVPPRQYGTRNSPLFSRLEHRIRLRDCEVARLRSKNKK